MNLQDEILKMVVENKMPIVMFLQFLIHKALSYYVKGGHKSLKGFIKFVIGKSDEPRA